MELDEAIVAYSDQIKHVLSQTTPPPTDEWIEAQVQRLLGTASRNANGNGRRVDADRST
jgi:hypothetical protein